MNKIAAFIFVIVMLYSGSAYAAPKAGVIVSRGAEVSGHVLAGCGGYNDASEDTINGALGDVAVSGGFTGGVIVKSVYSAGGAGSLAGYAGTASAVSKLGLGGATTAIAGAMGSSATGAAATAVVTTAVGGPVVMGGIIVGGSAAISYGFYRGGQAIWNWRTSSDMEEK